MTGETPLWRQVNPRWIREGRVTSQLFKPTRRDDNKVSVDNGDLVSAEEAHRSFAERYGSVGVLAVSAGECAIQELVVVPDPQENRPAHTTIDFSGLTASRTKKAAERLRDDAVRRGWQYQPPDTS